VYKKLGQPSQAMVNLTRALDLSPKDAQQIKVSTPNHNPDPYPNPNPDPNPGPNPNPNPNP